MENKEIQKPFIVEIEEAKNEIIVAINSALQEHRLPAYIVNMILSELGAQIKEGAKSELAMAKQQIENPAEEA